MGRVYDEELQLIPPTAQWASQFDISPWTDGFTRLIERDLVVVASGGSIAAAQFAAQLHTFHTGRMAVVRTPLEFVSEAHPRNAAVLFISAGGSNNDILESWQIAHLRGIRHRGLLCGLKGSPLAQLAEFSQAQVTITFDVPAGRDGFLATNSLIAFCSLILRLYGHTPPTISFSESTVPSGRIFEKSTLIVLYGGWLKPVAIDIESRFSEAALGPVQIADFRNFAHGRHHWLAKRSADTALLALISPRFAELANSTLDQLPPNIAVEKWNFLCEGPELILPALLDSMVFAGAAAQRLGYDAGRPGVPEFGHRIYELTTVSIADAQPSETRLAINRKMCAAASRDSTDEARFSEGLARFNASLTNSRLSAVVLDYDGTIVATSRRFLPIETRVASQINRVLREGLLVGVATGRGKSVHEKLRAAIAEEHWPRIWIGYYNGGVIRSLAESCDCILETQVDKDIERAAELLRASSELSGAKIDVRPTQITVTRADTEEHGLWIRVCSVLTQHPFAGLKVAHSSHSVDVIPRCVTKRAVVDKLARICSVDESSVLKIGDRGAWPGNDADLLSLSHGLSVDQVSADPQSCWNLLPGELLGPEGAVFYLERVISGRYQAT